MRGRPPARVIASELGRGRVGRPWAPSANSRKLRDCDRASRGLAKYLGVGTEAKVSSGRHVGHARGHGCSIPTSPTQSDLLAPAGAGSAIRLVSSTRTFSTSGMA